MKYTTGLDLKVERVRDRVKQREIALSMGVSVSRVSKIEALGHVHPDLAARYRVALGTCRTGTSEIA